MTRRYWLLLSSAAVAGLSFACSSKHSCRETRTCPAAGGQSAGADGEAAGQAGALDEGSGGRARGAGGNSSRTSESEGGEGGEGGAPDSGPVLLGACSDKGAFACVEHAGAQRPACDGERWLAGTNCSATQLCDSSDGKCAPIVSECVSAKPGASVCRGDSVFKCGVDLVTASEDHLCAGRCVLGVCQAPVCGDEKVERGEDCETTAATAPGACVNCKAASCGDGVVYEGHEQCDDGNLVSGDGCSPTCRAEPVQLALGDEFTCALSSTGLVKCWGANALGQLGRGDIEERGTTPDTMPSRLNAIDLGSNVKATSLTAHGSSVCARLEHGEAKCWGNNSFGQLGTADNAHRGDGSGEMGDALKPIPLGAEVKALSAGGAHTCALLAGGNVKCWGSNEYGQLGQENTVDVLSPKDLAPIKLKLPAVAISASSLLSLGRGGIVGGATCALLNNGGVQCWGYEGVVPHTSTSDLNQSYGIGDSSGEISALPALAFEGGRPARAIVAGNLSAAILNDGSLRLWGYGYQSSNAASIGMTPDELAALPAVQMGSKVVSVDTSARHTCAILDGGSLKCWGNVDSGALGLGSTLVTQGAPKDIPFVDLGGVAALQVATGAAHTCAILADGTVKCWGANNHGQLGLGDTQNRGNTGTKLSIDTTVPLSF